MTAALVPIPEDIVELRQSAAVYLAGQGFGIVHVPSGTKAPSGIAWQRRATTDPDVIRAMLATEDDGFGLLPPEGSGLLIIDEDVPGALDALVAAMGPTLTVRTGRGTRHVYLRTDPADEARIPRSWAGGQVRISGSGQVVGPWCRHSTGRLYLAEGTTRHIATALAEVIVARLPRATRLTNGADPGFRVAEPGRHDFLLARGRWLRGHGLTGERLRDELRRLNAGHCDPPKPEAEVDLIVDWITENIGDDPYDPVDGQRGEPLANRRAITFRTGRETAASAPSSYAYVWRPYAAIGNVTEEDGKPKVAGKTELTLHMTRAVLDGVPFLGQPTTRSPVVLLTEQSAHSIGPKLRSLGLDRDDLAVLCWADSMGTPWPEIVTAAEAECERLGALLLVVDTIGQFAGIRGDGENDAGAAMEAMAPLQAVAARGRAVWINRHDRKAGGEVGESGRGSNAWTGAVDCVISLRRPLNPPRSTIREIEAISRRGDVPPGPVLIELTPAGYVVLGSEQAVAFSETRAAILELFADQEWHTVPAIVEEFGSTRATVRRALDALVDDGAVERLPGEAVTKPHRYRLLPDPVAASPSVGQHVVVGLRTAEATSVGTAEGRPNLASVWDRIDPGAA